MRSLADSYRKGQLVQGWQSEAVARRYIGERGCGKYFAHRPGQSASYDVPEEAVNLGGLETHDTLGIIPGVGFPSILEHTLPSSVCGRKPTPSCPRPDPTHPFPSSGR